MTVGEQLEEWANGRPTHNKDRDECCPDFSCCRPDLLAPEDVRRKFCAADEATRRGMLMHFLSAAVANKGVYIAGGGAPQ